MTNDLGGIGRYSWRDRFPWLIILRTFGLSVSLPLILAAVMGVSLTPVGWRISQFLFIGDLAEYNDEAFVGLVERNSTWIAGPSTTASEEFQAWVPRDAARLPGFLQWVFAQAPGNVGTVYWRFVEPMRGLFDHNTSTRQTAYFLFGFLWMVLVWSAAGGVITRIAVVRLGREEPMGVKDAIRYVRQRYWAYVASPIFPLIGVLLVLMFIIPLGWIVRLDLGAVLVSVIWIPILLGGFVLLILLLGLLVGWPLMWCTVSSEEYGDAFEAFSRTYSYVFQRPLHYLFYATVALLFSSLCWLLIAFSSESVISLSEWSLAWGAGSERVDELMPAAISADSIAGSLFAIGTGLVRCIAASVSYSLFWCIAAAIYLLLRYDVDHTEMDEVYLADDDYGESLPDLPKDEAGVAGAPEVQDKPVDESREESDSSATETAETSEDEPSDNEPKKEE